MTAYDVKKFLDEHWELILHLADAPFKCTCSPDKKAPCTACDTHQLYLDLRAILYDWDARSLDRGNQYAL